MYSSAENAFGALDFTGLGYVTEEAFMESIIVKERQPYTKEQISLFFKDQNIFMKGQKGITFDNFKKIFFPHLYSV